MPIKRAHTTLWLAFMALLLPILAACGGTGDVANIPLPTAVVPTGASQPTIGQVLSPTAAPPMPTAGEAPTSAPEPTSDQPAGEAGFPLRMKYLGFGVVSHLYYTDRERALTLASIAGFEWVRQQIHWRDIEGQPGQYAWGELDNIVNDVAAHNQRLLISIVKSPTFYNPTNGLPQNPKNMGAFVEAMMQRYGNKIGAIEIWNEQNLAVENGGQVTVDDAGRYVEILVECFKRIKAVSPQTFVLAGAPSSSGVNDPTLAVSDENYYRAMYSYKNGLIKDYFDAQAVHPGGAANPPDTLFPEKPSFIEGCQPSPTQCWNDDSTHYFRHMENIRRFMEEEGVGDHQMWVTEFGWATQNDTPGYEFGNFVTPQQQADYIIAALKRMNEQYIDDQGRPWVGVAFLWNLNFAVLKATEGQPLHEQASFGILNPDWSPRPSFLALQAYLHQVKQARK